MQIPFWTRPQRPLRCSALLRETARTNPYWLSAVVSSCQEFPQRLDWSRTRYRDFEGITKAELDALAAQYLAPARATCVTVLPAAPAPAPPKP